MKIGKLAKISNCSIQAIRYYEKESLLDPPPRSEGNFRLYGKSSLSRLNFIKQCRNLGITLAEIRQLIQLQQEPSASCEDITNLIENRLKEVEVRLKELKQLRSNLQDLRSNCDNTNEIKDCGILENLSSDSVQ
jgi:Cd(II)/Pb(II)-responsive transcriptional regulator